jgi:hypothetical protein
MSFRGKVLVGLISLFCFCLGVTATILVSPTRNLSDAFPHARTYSFRVRSSRWERNYYSASESFADKEISRTISGLSGVADDQTLDKLQMQIARLESTGRAYLGVYLRYGYNCAVVDQTEEGMPADYAFHRNDQIVGLGNFTVTDNDSLRRALLNLEPGVAVMVKYYRNGNLEDAIITPVSKSVGQMPLSHRALGIAYASLGRTVDAAKQFESCKRESPYSSDDSVNLSSGSR